MAWLSGAKEIAKYCGVTPKTVYDWVSQKTTKVPPIMKVQRILKSTPYMLDDWLKSTISRRHIKVD